VPVVKEGTKDEVARGQKMSNDVAQLSFASLDSSVGQIEEVVRDASRYAKDCESVCEFLASDAG
jgi:hypothetical protein